MCSPGKGELETAFLGPAESSFPMANSPANSRSTLASDGKNESLRGCAWFIRWNHPDAFPGSFSLRPVDKSRGHSRSALSYLPPAQDQASTDDCSGGGPDCPVPSSLRAYWHERIDSSPIAAGGQARYSALPR